MISRNLLAVWLPLAAALAIGLTRRSRRAAVAGAAATVVLCSSWIAVVAQIDRSTALQRPEWRKVGAALGATTKRRLIVVERYPFGFPLHLYRPELVRVRGSTRASVSEVDVVVPEPPRGHSCWWGATCNLRPPCWWGSACNLSRARPPATPRGFVKRAELELANFDVDRFTAATPVRLRVRTLWRQLRHVGRGSVWLDQPSAAVRRRAA